MSGKSKARKKRHRSGTTADKIVGGPSNLPVADLPLLGDVLAKAKQIKNSMTSDSKGREVPNQKVVDRLYAEIVDMYRISNSNLVLLSEKSGKLKVLKAYTEHLKKNAGSSLI